MIFEDGSIVGRLDLHYQGSNVYGTLCTTADANEERIQLLIDAADEQLVMTADPYREDFIVRSGAARPPACIAMTPAPMTTTRTPSVSTDGPSQGR